MRYGRMDKKVIDVLKKIEEEVYLKPPYTVNQLCWDLQDRKDFFAESDVQLKAESVAVLCDIKFEWEKKQKSILFLIYYLQNSERFEEIKEILQDTESKDILEWLIKTNIAYALCGDIAKRICHYPDCVVMIGEDELIENYQNIFYIRGFRIYANENEMYDTWIRKQYLLESICEPCQGDIVLSVGAFYGETSLWFSEQVGDCGRVYAFEANAQNAWVARCNCKRNDVKNVVIENLCLWSSEEDVYMKSDFAHSCVSKNPNGIKMKAMTIDAYCEKHHLSKIDYIKMDIEGAEYEVLLGAQNVIKRDKPKLAICVYHSAEDFIRIPLKIKEYVPEYRLFLSHKREDLFETVIFATI